MNIVITGSDRPLGEKLCEALSGSYTIKPLNRHTCDHREMAHIAGVLDGVGAIIHCDVFDTPITDDQDCLDWASRGTFVLMKAAVEAGVERVILISSLTLFDDYPSDYVIDENWRPKPTPNAVSLAPYLAELTCREFARQGGIYSFCLRFDPEVHTHIDLAAQAVMGALRFGFEPNGYRWHLAHVSQNERFSTRQAKTAGLLGENI